MKSQQINNIKHKTHTHTHIIHRETQSDIQTPHVHAPNPNTATHSCIVLHTIMGISDSAMGVNKMRNKDQC